MSARDDLFRRVAGAFVDESKANALIDAFADEARAGQATEIDRLRAEIRQLDRTLDEVMTERDSAHDALDRMALAVAPEDVIGEHSSGNNPWANALELITPAAEIDRLRTELRVANEQLAEVTAACRATETDRDALKQRLHDAAMARVWTNEDGKKFVFADDIKGPLLGISSEATS